MIRKIIIRIFLLLALILGANLLILQQLDRSFYWGSSALAEKWNDLFQNHQNCNTLFIGTSKTHRGVMPSLFDSLALGGGVVRSYNLGVPSMAAVETYHLINHLLDEDNISLKWIFVELNGVQYGPGLYRIPRGKYFMDFNHYKFALQSIPQTHLDWKGKLHVLRQYSVNYAERLTLYGLLREYRRNVTDFDTTRLAPYRYHDKGFLSYEMELAHSSPENRERLIKKHQSFLLDTTAIRKKLAFAPAPIALKANNAHLKKIKELQIKASKKGITLIFYSMPSAKMFNTHLEVQSLINHLKDKNGIELGNGELYPDFFQTENLYNVEHLNERGARLFTTALATEFNNK